MFKLRSTKNVFITEFNENDGTFKAVTNQEGPWSIEYQRIEGNRAVNKKLSGYARSNPACDMRIKVWDTFQEGVYEEAGFFTECPGRKRKDLGTLYPGQIITLYPVKDMVSPVQPGMSYPADGSVVFSYRGCTGNEKFDELDPQYPTGLDRKCAAIPKLIVPKFSLNGSPEPYPVLAVLNIDQFSNLEFSTNPPENAPLDLRVFDAITEGLDLDPEYEYKLSFDYMCTGSVKTCGIDYTFKLATATYVADDFRLECASVAGYIQDPPLGSIPEGTIVYRQVYNSGLYDFNQPIYIGTEKALSEASLPYGPYIVSIETLLTSLQTGLFPSWTPDPLPDCLIKYGDCDDLVITGIWGFVDRFEENSIFYNIPYDLDWWIGNFGPDPTLDAATDVSFPEDYEHGIKEFAQKTAIVGGGYAELVDIIPAVNAAPLVKINPYLGPVHLTLALQCINADKTELLGTQKLLPILIGVPPGAPWSNFVGSSYEFLPVITVPDNIPVQDYTITHTFPDVIRCNDYDPSITTKFAFDTTGCHIVDANYDTGEVTVGFTPKFSGLYGYFIYAHCLCEVPMDPVNPSKTVYSPLGGARGSRWPGGIEGHASHQTAEGVIFFYNEFPIINNEPTEEIVISQFSPQVTSTLGPDQTVCTGNRILSILPGSEHNVVVEEVNNTNKTIKFKPTSNRFLFIYSVSCGGEVVKNYIVMGNNHMPIEVEYNSPI